MLNTNVKFFWMNRENIITNEGKEHLSKVGDIEIYLSKP